MLSRYLSNLTDDDASGMAALASAIGRYVQTGEGKEELTELLRTVIPGGGR